MRLRNIPIAKEALLESNFCIDEPSVLKGQWNLSFNNNNPIYIEVGVGKGQFILAQSIEHPDINFVGIEYYSSVLYRALQKVEASPCDNIKLIRFDAKYICDIFASSEVSRIYLNFSDPWPKDRHAKRRLTSPDFLNSYAVILKSGSRIEFKTDNFSLFEYSVESIESHPDFRLEYITRDLHSDESEMRTNIMTEYEERFSEKGNPICKLVALRK